ncbi:MAG TPA: hypothetical protein VJO33_03410 [Gemmatimonadaceae bacterium]|nr:hypothetical protein [Gemmatimonadaceae bacterium]
MVSFQFVDANGLAWMILPGLPADYPDIGEDPNDNPLPTGLTFRASTGEVRVLPRAAIPRRVSSPHPLPSLGTTSRVPRPEPLDWEELLRHALVWPPV